MTPDEIRIGVVATLIGPFMDMGMDGIRGVELAVSEFGWEVGGKRLTLFKESSNAIPASAVDATVSLLDRKRVDFVVGPLSGNEGLAVRDYAKIRPDVTFLNGSSGAQDMTLRDPAPNFFSFSTNGVQWMSGLGQYVANVKGWRRIVTLAEDYSYPHGQVAGFMIDYYRAGGTVVEKFWVALGTADYRAIIEAMPDDIDAIFACVGGSDAVNFLRQYAETGRKTPLIGGSITIDQNVLSLRGELAQALVGMPSSGPTADNNPDPVWQAFVSAYRATFPRALPYPSLACWGYYVNTKAALLALQQVHGDLSDGQRAFRAALASLEFESPTGIIRLDHNRNAIADVFLTEVAQREDGTLYNRLVQVTREVNQTMGIDEAAWLRMGAFNKTNPPHDRTVFDLATAFA